MHFSAPPRSRTGPSAWVPFSSFRLVAFAMSGCGFEGY
jgi:hypothetical protein